MCLASLDVTSGNMGTLPLIINGVVTSGGMGGLPLIINGCMYFCQPAHSFADLSSSPLAINGVKFV